MIDVPVLLRVVLQTSQVFMRRSGQAVWPDALALSAGGWSLENLRGLGCGFTGGAPVLSPALRTLIMINSALLT